MYGKQRSSERLSSEVGCLLGIAHALRVKGENRLAVATVEGLEPASPAAALAQQLSVLALSCLHNPIDAQHASL